MCNNVSGKRRKKNRINPDINPNINQKTTLEENRKKIASMLYNT